MVQVQITGQGGGPVGAAAALVNLTATNTSASGFVTAYPANRSRPYASNLNIPSPGSTVANAAWVPLSPDGKLSLYTQRALDLVLDVSGWFTADVAPVSTEGLFMPTDPTRMLDTRPHGPQTGYTGGKPGGGATVPLTLAGRSPLPSGGFNAVIATVTATESEGSGFVTVYPAGEGRPLASNLNLTAADQTRPNLVTTPVGAGGLTFYTKSGTHLITDVAGYFLTDLDPPPALPSSSSVKTGLPRVWLTPHV